MDVGRSFSYMFKDEDWAKKLALGGLFNLIPVFGAVTSGYALRVIRNSARGGEPRLPEWDEIGSDWAKGLMRWLGLLILSLPLLPGLVGSGMFSDGMDSGTMSPLLLCCCGFICLSGLWGLLLGVVFPVARTHYALTGEFASFFRVRKLWQGLSRQLGDYIVVILLIVVLQSLALVAGSLLCFVGIAFTMFYAQLVVADLLGQVAAADGATVAPRPAPLAPRPARTTETIDLSSADAELHAQLEDEANPPDHEDYGGPEA